MDPKFPGIVSCASSKLKIAITVTENNPGTPAGDYYTATGLARELERLGYEVVLLAMIPRMQWYDPPPDIDVMLVLMEGCNIKKVKTGKKIITVAWIRNHLEKWLSRRWFDAYDMILASSEESRRIVKERTGRDSGVLMIGVDPEVFKPLPPEKQYECDMVFTGNYWGVDREIIDALDVRPEWDFRLYGRGWNRVRRLKGYWKGFVNYSELPKIYSSAKIVLDDHNHVTKPYGMINSRTFEAMACGACVITNAAKDIEKVFPWAVNVYHDGGELTRLIDSLLKDEGKRKEMGERARRLVLEDHTYRSRALQFGEYLEVFTGRTAGGS